MTESLVSAPPNMDEKEKLRQARDSISDLFLDTDNREEDLEFIAKRLKETGYSIEELERIYSEEVAPAVHWNTLSVAGVWGRFSTAWLEKTIEGKKKFVSNLKSIPLVWPIYRKWVTWTTSSNWLIVKRKMQDSSNHSPMETAP